MEHNSTASNTSLKRQNVIDWLVAYNYPALPVAPAQSPWKHHKIVPAHAERGVWSYCPLVVVQMSEGTSFQPIPLYTGKNPSYLDSSGCPHLVNHRQYQNRLPRDSELDVWFANPANGIGTLGGWNDTVWLDFDVKQFSSQQECDAAVLKILETLERYSPSSSSSAIPPSCGDSLQQYYPTFVERTHSGGWRIAIRVKQKPNFTNFSLTPGGSHVGEALCSGRFTVLAPTIGPSGNPYCSLGRILPIEVESLESIGIHSTRSANKCEVGRMKALRHVSVSEAIATQGASAGRASVQDEKTLPTSSFTLGPSLGSIPLELLGTETATQILYGNCPTGDRSEALATAIQEWYGWQNWASDNGIPISGDAVRLAHHAGSLLGLDSDRINRILKTIDVGASQPAALYRGGEESCWKKIYRLSRIAFEANCPAHIKEFICRDKGYPVSTECGSERVRPLQIGNGSALGADAKYRDGIGSGEDKGDGGEFSVMMLADRSAAGGSTRTGFASERTARGGEVSSPPASSSTHLPNTLPHRSGSIRRQIEDVLIQDLPPSELQMAKIRIRTNNPGLSERELSKAFETLEQEQELALSRESRRQEVDDLLKLGDRSLSLSEFLPTDLAEPLEELARGLNIRPEVCLTFLLVATSSLYKTQTELVLHKGQCFSVPPTIFAGLVSESGQKKSPILKALVKKPMAVLQREKREAYSTNLAQHEKDIAKWDKCSPEERDSKFPEGKPNKPTQQLYYFTNTTGEGLLYQFQAHPDKALLALVDELVGLFASQNKYSGGKGSDRQDILSAFDGTGATVLRASGTKADIDGLLLSICGTIQPEVLKQLMRDCSDPDGQWARFLFVNQPLAAATLADDDGGGVDLTGRLLDYYRTIDRLPAMEFRLSRAAFKRYQRVYNQLERLRVSHANPGMRAVYSKMEGYIGRLALNLHVLHELSGRRSSEALARPETGNRERATGEENKGTRPISPEIGLEVMEKAIALAKFYIGQVKLIHANCSADLGEMAPHLAKIVELSKRMEATTGNSWIKAKMVQSGYDSRHRPRPDVIRSWFRELEALSLGSTQGSGIRLEYSWKLPDPPWDSGGQGESGEPGGRGSDFTDSAKRSPLELAAPTVDTTSASRTPPLSSPSLSSLSSSPSFPTTLPPLLKEVTPPQPVGVYLHPPVQKVEKSGEKWITSPPTESTLIQGFPPKVEKVDNPTHKGSFEVGSTFAPQEELSTQSQEGGAHRSRGEALAKGNSWVHGAGSRTSSPAPSFVPPTKKSISINDSTYPLSRGNDGGATPAAVDTISTFSPPVEEDSSSKEPKALEVRSVCTGVSLLRPQDCAQFQSQIPHLEATDAMPYSCVGAQASNEEPKQLSSQQEPAEKLNVSVAKRASVQVLRLLLSYRDADSTIAHRELFGDIQESMVLSVFLENQCKGLMDSPPRDVVVEANCNTPVQGKVVLSVATPHEPLSSSGRNARVLVTVEESCVPKGLDETELLAARTVVGILQSGLLGGERVGDSQRSPATDSPNSPATNQLESCQHLVESEKLDVESLFIPELDGNAWKKAVRASTADSSKFVRLCDSDAREAQTMPATIASDAEVDQQKEGVGVHGDAGGPCYSIGSRVHWTNCPGHCERFAPFEITAIDGDFAKLDLFEKPVPLAELQLPRAQ